MSSIISALSKTKNKVYQLLIDLPSTRDSDARLVAFYHTQELGGIDVCKQLTAYEYMRMIIAGKLTNPANIERARRKVQEHFPETRGKEYEKRKQKENEVRETIKNI